MRGGSLTRFKTDLDDQEGAGVIKDTLKGGLKGAIKTRNPLKLPSNISKGAKEGFKRGLKRKATQVLEKELGKVLKKPKVKQAVKVTTALFPKQVKKVKRYFREIAFTRKEFAKNLKELLKSELRKATLFVRINRWNPYPRDPRLSGGIKA